MKVSPYASLVGFLLFLMTLYFYNLPVDANAEAQGLNDNLIENGDFEQGVFGPWITCGGAQIVDAQANGITPLMVHGGRYAVRIGAPTDKSCGNDAFFGPNQVIAEDVTIPSDADEVTLSFWYSAVGAYSVGEVIFEFGTKPTSYLGSSVLINQVKMDELMPGWHLFRQNLNGEQLAALRGQTTYLLLRIRLANNSGEEWAIYFDDVRIVPVREKTQASPFPADLQGDGTRPLLVAGPGLIPNSYALYRMDTDGGNRVGLITETLQLRQPTWSPDGQKIVFQTDAITPERFDDPDKFPALFAYANLIDADGGNYRRILRTLGVPGQKEKPPGCLRTNTCANPGSDAYDGLLTNFVWSPDSKQLLSTSCHENRWYNGDKQFNRNRSCDLAINEIPALDAPLGEIDPNIAITSAANADWFADGRILFDAYSSLTSPRTASVWERNLNTAQNKLLTTWLTNYSGGSLDLRSNPDQHPSWAPDGRHFVTYRQVEGYHYYSPTAPFDLNHAIILYDRENLQEPGRQLLLVDHGQLSGRPTWSPNGTYVLYTLFNDEGTQADIWWLEVATGKTGKVTNDGVSLFADWRPTHTIPNSPTATATATATQSNVPTPTSDPSFNKRVYLPLTQRAQSTTPTPTRQATATLPPGVTPTKSPTPFSFATPIPTATRTPLPTPANPTAVPPRGISGFVTYQGAPIAGINVQLETCFVSLPCEMRVRTVTDANGMYNFPYAPTSNGILGYLVTYRNGSEGGNPDDPRFLQLWQSRQIFDYDYAERVPGGDFDIANVELLTADNANLTLPATFRWNKRTGSDEKYTWVFRQDFFGLCGQSQPGDNSEFTFTSLMCQFPELQFNTTYQWSVRVTREGENGGVGMTKERNVIFME